MTKPGVVIILGKGHNGIYQGKITNGMVRPIPYSSALYLGIIQFYRVSVLVILGVKYHLNNFCCYLLGAKHFILIFFNCNHNPATSL